MWPPIPLVVIDPNHGMAIYTWEKKQLHDNNWKKIDVPSYTCLLYVDTTMQYRCSVNDKIVVFNVKFKGTNINIVIVTLIPHSLLLEKKYDKPKKGNGVLCFLITAFSYSLHRLACRP